MKTHIPAKLRKALIAALFAVSAVAYNAQAEYNDDFNVGSDARNSVTDTYLDADALGYVDFTFRGLDPVLGTAHFTHSIIPVDYYTRLVATVGSSGKYEFHSLKADQGCDPEYDIHTGQYSGEGMGYYSTSWSNGNITMTDEAVMEVTASISANGAININGASRVTAGNQVTAGEIQLTGSSLTTGNISVSQNDLWVPGEDSIKSSGELSISGSNANVTATGTVSAVGAVNVSQGAYLNADKVAAGEINVNDSSLTAGNITVTKNSLWVAGGDPIESSGELSISGSNANVTATGTVSAVGAVNVSQGAYLNADKVAAGEINVNDSSLTAGNITVTKNSLWVAGGDPIESSGELSISGSNANVTATGIVSAAGGVAVSQGAHLNASKIISKVTGNAGYVRALPNQNLTVTGVVASEKTQYIVDNGYTISLGGIGELVNEGTEDEPVMVMHGNGNYFGYGEDSNNIKADAIYVMGDIISDNNSLAALGSAVYDHTEDIDSAAICVDGSITGNGNELFVRGQDAAGIWVSQDIAGDHNELTINDGDIHVGGTLGRTKDGDNGAVGNSLAAGDDITIHQLSDNENLSIDAWNGEVTVEKASEATLLNSHITAMDDVVIAASETTGSNAKLKLINTDVTSEDGDITANQVLVVENGTLSAENGNVTAVGVDGKAATVHAIDLEAGNIKLNADTSSTAEVVLAGDMTSTKGTIIISNYNGADPRVTVDGTQQAQSTLDISNSNVAVGEDQKTVKGDMSVAGSTLTVGGNQDSARQLDISSSTVDIAGDEKAGTRLGVHSSTLTVGADQTAGATMAIDSGSKVTVGHVDEETGELVGGNQKAGMNINIEDSDVTVLADQTSTGGSIIIRDLDSTKNPTKVAVNGNQKAKTDITASGAELTVGIIEEIEDEETGEITYELHGGNQTAETGDISLSNAKVAILGHQDATEGNISITDGTTLKVGAVAEDGEIVQESNQTAKGNITISDSDVTVLGDQTSTEGSIAITDLDPTKNPTKVAVNGDQKAKTDITASGAELTVGIIEEIEDEETGEITYELHGGNQTAETGDISLSNAKVAILGHQDAMEGSISVINGSTLMVGAMTEDGEIVQESNQTAKKNITITDSDVTVLGDQTATTGKIAISVTDPELYSATVTVNGDQLAGNGISVDDATLTVGTIEETTTPWGWPVYTLHGGNQTAETGDITISHSDVNVLGDQTAETGAISVTKGSDLTVGCLDPNGFLLHAGNQTADTDITISDSDVKVLGDQTATTGKIAISVTDPELYSATVTVDGNQLAGNGISVDDSTLTVGVVREFTDMWGNKYSWLNGGNQTAETGDINITNSTVDILGHQEATAGSIGVFNSELMVGAIDSDGEIVQASNQTANQDIEIVDSYVNVLGNQIAEQGRIAIQSTGIEGTTPSEVIIGGEQTAHTDIIVTDSTLTVGTIETIEDEETGEITYELSGGNQTAETGDIRIDGSIADILGHQEATAGSIYVTGGSELTVGAMTEDGEIVQESDQLAQQDIKIVDSLVHVLGNETATEGSIVITVGEDGIAPVVTIDGDQEAGDSILTFGADLTVGYIEEIEDEETGEITYELHGGNQTADNGNIGIVATEATVYGNVTATGEDRGLVFVLDSTYDVGTSLTANELSIGTLFDTNASVVTINLTSATVEGEPLETVLDVDTLKVSKDSTLHTGNVKMDETDVTIKGAVEVGVKDEDPEKAIAANWDTEGSHLITGEDASLKANGNIRIAAVQDGDTIVVNDGARVAATGDVTIEGLADALAQVDNAHVVAKGDVTFSNAVLSNNAKPQIRSTEGDIVLKDRVEISDTQLNILAPEGTQPGSIVVEKGADVQLYQGTVDVFNGALAGTGTVTANDENLVISYDSPDFNGTINMVRDNEQTLYIASKGVGDKAILSMHKGSSLGTIVGGQDANLGNVVTTDGSHIQMNAVDKGNRTTATSLNLTAGTTYELFASTDDTTGALLADTITVSNGINANGARVRVHSDTPLESLADGSRFTIAGGTVVSGFNEDVLYDMVKPDPTAKRTARALQTRNMHVEHTAHGADLVVSVNYKGIDDRNTNAVAVRDVILPLDVAADHRPGKLAGSASELDHVLDALDYTRSGADAREGLLSLSGAANLIVPNMMMDASRHHLSDLRDHMKAPVCTDTRKTKGNVWAAYIGGYDHIGSDENMHAYSHSYQGALVGGDYALNCNWAVGLSLGYQKSIARTEGTRADADAISGDLYAVGRTGKYTHRFSMGLTSYSTDVKRGTRIAAAGHTYYGQSTGSADGMSWNFGYQLSRDFTINQVSTITPYLAVDVALQRIDTLNEKGQGDASVVTDYEDFVQTDAALGVAYSHTFASFNRQTGVFSLNLAAHGEFSEHRATAKNHFAGYADTWKTRSMKRAPFYGEVGADVIVPFGEHISGTAGVNFEFSADRTFVGGHAGVNYRF